MNTGQDKLKEIIQKENEQRQQDMMVGRFDNFSLLLSIWILLFQRCNSKSCCFYPLCFIFCVSFICTYIGTWLLFWIAPLIVFSITTIALVKDVALSHYHAFKRIEEKKQRQYTKNKAKNIMSFNFKRRNSEKNIHCYRNNWKFSNFIILGYRSVCEERKRRKEKGNKWHSGKIKIRRRKTRR